MNTLVHPGGDIFFIAKHYLQYLYTCLGQYIEMHSDIIIFTTVLRLSCYSLTVSSLLHYINLNIWNLQTQVSFVNIDDYKGI